MKPVHIDERLAVCGGEVLDGRMAKTGLMQFGARHGFDPSGGVAWLATHGR